MTDLPGEVWRRLKEWAKTHALQDSSPTLQDCNDCVERVVAEITGRRGALRPEVVSFYADEALAMIDSLRCEPAVQVEPAT